MLKRVELLLHKKIDSLLANSHAVIDNLKSEGVAEEKLVLIYNGTKPHTPSDNASMLYKEFGLKPDTLVIACVANLIAYKGHEDLIRSLAAIENDVEYKCFMIGYDTGIQKELEQLADSLNIMDKIIFTGSRSDVPDFYDIADIGVLTSREEGFSNSILEAMAAGLPMVVTDIGGNAEAVDDKVNGFVVQKGDVDSISKSIDSLLGSKSLRQEYGANSRAIIKDKFTIERCVKSYENFYIKGQAYM